MPPATRNLSLQRDGSEGSSFIHNYVASQDFITCLDSTGQRRQAKHSGAPSAYCKRLLKQNWGHENQCKCVFSAPLKNEPVAITEVSSTAVWSGRMLEHPPEGWLVMSFRISEAALEMKDKLEVLSCFHPSSVVGKPDKYSFLMLKKILSIFRLLYIIYLILYSLLTFFICNKMSLF